MICPSCNKPLLVSSKRKKGGGYKIQAECVKCSTKSSIYHIDDYDDIEAAQTAAQRELLTSYEIEIENNAPEPDELSYYNIGIAIARLKSMICEGKACGACPLQNDSDIFSSFGLACYMTAGERSDKFREFVKEHVY